MWLNPELRQVVRQEPPMQEATYQKRITHQEATVERLTLLLLAIEVALTSQMVLQKIEIKAIHLVEL